jgi:hypothetical protein
MSWANRQGKNASAGRSRAKSCRKRGEGIAKARWLRLESLESRRLLSVAPFISEVAAANSTGILDSAGASSDWLEICNPDPTTAVNLAGWSLVYQKTGSGKSTTWTVPSNDSIILGPNESRVFFCDSSSSTDPAQELHTNFNLSKAGATVQLLNAASVQVSTLTYPALSTDTSYGVGETVNETDLVAAGATATYFCPTNNSLGTTWTQPGFNDSSWSSGPTGLGYGVVPGFATTLYKANITVSSLALAQTVVSTSSDQTSATSATEDVLNFLDTGGDGHFNGDSPFPGMKIGQGWSNYVMQATGTITVTASQAGYYTFGVNSDDGFSLSITGASFTTLTNATNSAGSNTMQYANTRGAGDTLGTTYLAAGTYPVSLVYYQDGGNAETEFYAAKESGASGVTTFDATNSHLVGDAGSGGLAVTSRLFTGQTVSGVPLSHAVQTNVSSKVQAAVAAAGGMTSLYSRITFNAANLASLTNLTLRMQYGSAYVAYLDGVEIASRNAPSSPTWNSAALEYRNSPVQDTTYEDVDISSFLNPGTSGHLTATGNVLAIQTLMATTTDPDLFVSPAISAISIAQAGLHTFATPSPGAYNTPSTWQPDLSFSVQHGFYTAPFQLALTTTTAGASVYYTTDSSTPGCLVISGITYSGTTATVTTADPVDYVTGETVQIANATPAVYDGNFTINVPATVSLNNGADTYQFTYTLPSTPSSNASPVAGSVMTAIRGTPYTGPITISSTTNLRAVSEIAGQQGIVSTESYVFLASVINQPASPTGFPASWGETTSSTTQAANYAMNTQITQNALYSSGLTQDFLSLPTVSITTDIPNFVSAVQSQTTNPGIYSNETNLVQGSVSGIALKMEVPASFEYFNSSGSISVQANMGLQMEGGVGRDPQYEKHSFRMQFSSDYGPASLNYPLFPGDPVTSFENVDLKAAFNDGFSWAGSGTPPGNAAQYMRDIFASNNMLAMQQPGFSSQYVLLYIDGLFWGMYYMAERPDADFAAAHLGGTASDWEVNNDGHEVDGESTALPYWNAFQNLPTTAANESISTSSLAFYEMAQGDNPDGTPNSSYTDLLDPTNYVDYLLMNFYIGNTDWPWHNYYAGINTVDPTGFKFFSWDGEMSVGMINGSFNSSLTANVLGVSSGAIKYSGGNGVATMYAALYSNPEFDMAFADQARQMLFDGGVLTPTAAASRYQSQINTIEQAMVLESARWGNIPTSAGPIPNTQAGWLNEANWIVNTYLPQRTAIVISQLQAAGLYPSINAPEFYVNGVDEYGGTFKTGSTLTLSGANLPAGAAIYYTLDGSDPRLLGGALNTASDVFLYSGPITLTLNEEVRARVYSNGTWSAISEAQFTPNLSSLRVTEVMYDPAPATAAEIAAGYVTSDTSEPWKDFQFIEIENTGTQTVPLGGLQISGGIDFTFPTYQGNIGTNPVLTLAPNSYVVAVADASAFAIRYGAGLNSLFGGNWQNLIVAGQFADHHLSDSSDEVNLSDASGNVIQDFTYQSSWYPQTQGGSFSLTVRSATEALPLWDSSSGWESSGAPNGTPGTAETTATPLPGSVVINEALSNPTAAGGDMIELYNTTAQAIGVGGWWLSDSTANLTMYQIPAGTSVAAGSYLVLSDAKNYGPGSGDPGAKAPFVLSKYGFTVCLSSNYNGAAGGYQVQQTYGATPPGISAGLVATSTGNSDFVLLAVPTFGQPVGGVYPGAANSLAYVAPIVMDELQYDPSQPTAAEANAGYTDNDDFEFLELYNRSHTTQSLSGYFMGNGVGFTFGWVPDGTSDESETLESGATATWTTNALAAGAYTVYADYSLTDPAGNSRDVDAQAQYKITYPGGSSTVTLDQGTAVSGQLSLGTITTTGVGTVQVQLLRQSTASPSQWTLANQVEFVKTGVDLKVGSPALTSFATSSGITALAPGAYVVLVSDIQAFDFRYGTGLPVAGQYTGHQNNGGELMALDQFGESDSETGYIPVYEVDRVQYSDAAPWPTLAAGNGPALIRANTADYGSDPLNWLNSNVGGTPGAANVILDPIPPTVPTVLTAHTSLSPSQVALSWMASTDPRSNVAYYVVYRNGQWLGTSTTTSYADTSAAVATNYTYTVSAVNRDGYASAQSASVVAGAPGVTSYAWIDSKDIDIYFSEPLTSATGAVLGHYTITGGIVFSAVNLSRDGTMVALTTSQSLTTGNAYTITMTGLATASGDPLPASFPLSMTYQTATGEILDQIWDNLDGNGTVNDLTNPALNPNYPNNPSYATYLTSFEAPHNTGTSDYGQRVQGYIDPTTTGAYTFWIASDDYSQLWLSTNASSANIGTSPIAYVNGYTGFETWNTYASQQSAVINLVAGQRYYIEALMKQGGGSDNLSVAWMPPGGTSIPAQGSAYGATTLAYSGTTATATFSSAPGFVVGQSVLIAGVTGANASLYNGTFAITAVSGATISYTMTGTPTANATGSISVRPYGISYSGTTAYVWLPNHGYASGSWIDIAGATPTAYDGVYTISNVTANTFTYTMSTTPTAVAAGTIIANKISPIPGTYLSPYGGNEDLALPSAPANLQATLNGGNNQVMLAWSPVQDVTSGIDHYVIYRDGSVYATSTGITYTDSSGISASARHSYAVAAVNYDGVQGASSLTVSLSAAGIASITTPSSTSVLVTFTEPVDAASSQVAGNYQIGGVTVSSAVLESNGCSVLLTTSAMAVGSYTLTVSNVWTSTLSVLTTSPTGFTYAPLPAPSSVDIGSPGLPGSAAYSNGAWTIVGGGGDVWQGTDQCHYLYVPVTTTAAATWIVHIASLTGNSGDSGWTKAGIMARAGTATLVADTFDAETSGNNVTFQWTSTAGQAPNNDVTGGTATPQWLEMTYDGAGNFNSYYSNNTNVSPPTSWTQIGAQQTVTMPAGGFDIGLFVTAHNNSSTSTGVFDYNNFMSSGSNGGYAAPPFSVSVNSQTTNSTSPSISGASTDPVASLSVRINGRWYAIANNNGSWTLPDGDISPSLGSGTYNITVCGVNASGQAAFDSALNELTVATAEPTLVLPSLTTQTVAIGSLAIAFSEPVTGFNLQNLQLTLNGANLPLDGATLTSSDNEHWTVGNLGGITGASGAYSLSVNPGDWDVTDAAGNVFSSTVTTSWTRLPPAVQSITTSGSTITNASSLQYTVTFNEGVTDVLPADFALAVSGTSGAVASVSGSGSTYIVTVNNVSGNGTLSLNLADDDSIIDLSGNPLGGVGAGNGSFTGPKYTIDTTAPMISIGSPSATYATGGPETYAVTYADANFNTATLSPMNVTLIKSGTASGTIGVSGSGLSRTVTISGITGDGSLAISIVAGTASDLAGNLAPAAGPSAMFIVDNTGPTVVAAADAAPSSVAGSTTALSVLGADAATGENSLTYTWAASILPAGAEPPSFSANGANAAKGTACTFSTAGNYVLTVTITDPTGLSTTSNVGVSVSQTLTSISLASPSSTPLALDQFGNPLSNQPAFDPESETITGPLSLTGNTTIVSTAGCQLAFSGGIGGIGGLTVNGLGTVLLTGADSYSGGTTVISGLLVAASSNALPLGAALTVGAGNSLFDRAFAAAVGVATHGATGSGVGGVAKVQEGSDSLAILAHAAVTGTSASAESPVVEAAPRMVITTAAAFPAVFQTRVPTTADCGVAYGPRSPVAAGAASTAAADGLDSPELQRKKDVAILALDAVLARFGE